MTLVGALDQHVDDAQQTEGRPYRTFRLMRGAYARLDPPVEQRVLILREEVVPKVTPEGHQSALLQHVVERVEGADVVVLLVELFGGLRGSDCRNPGDLDVHFPIPLVDCRDRYIIAKKPQKVNSPKG